jgi:hypothetical protein
MANLNASPYIFPADQPTVIAAVAVTGNHFVKVAAGGVGNRPKVIPCSANTDIVLGVSMTSAAAATSLGLWRDGVVPVFATAALTAGDGVWPDGTGGAVVGGAGRPWGVCVADTAAGDNAPIALMIG